MRQKSNPGIYYFITIILLTLTTTLQSSGNRSGDYIKTRQIERDSTARADVKVNFSDYLLSMSSSMALDPGMSLSERPFVRNHAREESMRFLSVTLENLLIDSKRRVKDLLRDDSDFARRYSRFLEQAKIRGIFFRNHKIQVNMQVQLRSAEGFLKQIPLPWGTQEYQILQPAEYLGEAYQNSYAKSDFSATRVPVKYSGLVIDARKLGINPSFAPRIYTPTGKLIYGPEFVMARTGSERGLAAFVTSMSHPEVIHRAGRNYLLTAALGVMGKNSTDLVISQQDAARYFSHETSVKNLQKCRVVVLAD